MSLIIMTRFWVWNCDSLTCIFLVRGWCLMRILLGLRSLCTMLCLRRTFMPSAEMGHNIIAACNIVHNAMTIVSHNRAHEWCTLHWADADRGWANIRDTNTVLALTCPQIFPAYRYYTQKASCFSTQTTERLGWSGDKATLYSTYRCSTWGIYYVAGNFGEVFNLAI